MLMCGSRVKLIKINGDEVRFDAVGLLELIVIRTL